MSGTVKLTEIMREKDRRIAELEKLRDAIDDEMVATHLGTFNTGDDPKVALNKLMAWSQDVGAYFANDENKQLQNRIAELEARLETAYKEVEIHVAKNQRLRDALERIIMEYDPQYGCACSTVNRIAHKALEKET